MTIDQTPTLIIPKCFLNLVIFCRASSATLFPVIKARPFKNIPSICSSSIMYKISGLNLIIAIVSIDLFFWQRKIIIAIVDSQKELPIYRELEDANYNIYLPWRCQAAARWL